MFERYTETSRRVIFFSRYECSQFGAMSIESEHMLLGLLREDAEMVRHYLAAEDSVDAIRQDVETRAPATGKKTGTSTDLPLTQECKDALKYAADAAEALSSR